MAQRPSIYVSSRSVRWLAAALLALSTAACGAGSTALTPGPTATPVASGAPTGPATPAVTASPPASPAASTAVSGSCLPPELFALFKVHQIADIPMAQRIAFADALDAYDFGTDTKSITVRDNLVKDLRGTQGSTQDPQLDWGMTIAGGFLRVTSC
jgi:hypothetical protein